MRLCILNSNHDVLLEYKTDDVKELIKKYMETMDFDRAFDKVCEELRLKTVRL